MNSRRKVVEFMLKVSEREEEMIHAKDSCGSTPAMDAVRGGDAAIIDALIAAVGRNSLEASRDAMGRNVLHIAAHSGLGWRSYSHIVESNVGQQVVNEES